MNYLERLGIHPKVRSFFEPYMFFSGETVSFKQGEYVEHVSQSFQRVPITESYWTAGEAILAKDIFITGSAMDAIIWLQSSHVRFQNLQNLYFIAVGAVPCPIRAESIQKITHNKKLHFIFSNNPPGAICDLKLASFIRNKPLKISFKDNQFEVIFENQYYSFERLSLNALEKASGYNFRIRTHKPKNTSTYYEQHRIRY